MDEVTFAVDWNGDTFELRIPQLATVHMLKQQLQQRTKVPVGEQQLLGLTHNGMEHLSGELCMLELDDMTSPKHIILLGDAKADDDKALLGDYAPTTPSGAAAAADGMATPSPAGGAGDGVAVPLGGAVEPPRARRLFGGPPSPMAARRAHGAGGGPVVDAVAEERVAREVDRFVSTYEATYGALRPPFFEGSFRLATASATDLGKLLLVYLHGDDDSDGDDNGDDGGSVARFCSTTLCHDGVIQYIYNNFAIWGYDVSRSNTASVFEEALRRNFAGAPASAMDLAPTRFPYVAVVAVVDGWPKVLDRVEGYVAPTEFLGRLVEMHERFEPVLVAERERVAEASRAAAAAAEADRAQRQARERLRTEQESEYERSLAADRAKQREAERAREEAEMAEVMRASAAEAETQRLEALRAALPDEPAEGADGVARLAFRLPDSTRTQRRFLVTDTLDTVANWLDTQGYARGTYALVSSFPRAVYEDYTQTLGALGLAPQAMLIVETK